VVKPFHGAQNDGPSDASVLVPLDTLLDQPLPDNGGHLGLAIGAGINPWYGVLDPYAMAWAAVDEAVRNVVAVGADPDRIAILDNFCWGNPSLPDRLGGLVRCAEGCGDAALAFETPFVSGKDSLNNEYVGTDGVKRAIPGTLLISALGIVPDSSRTVTMDLKRAGDLLYVVGETRDEMGGSRYDALRGGARTTAPQPVREPLPRLRALHGAIRDGLVQACHDCSDGGLGIAAAEMALAGRLGLMVDVSTLPGTAGARADTRLFSESLGRFLVEVKPEDAAAFEARFAGKTPLARCGQVTADGKMRVASGSTPLFELSVADLVRAWKGGDGND
jgi:phosphoribosylformylglycinamidine synthase